MENKEQNQLTEKSDQTIKPNEIARMEVQAHLLIVDADTGEVLVNQRG